jgi:protein phosphatase
MNDPIQSAGQTDVGQTRENNEDHFLVSKAGDDPVAKTGPMPEKGQVHGGDDQLIAVADGLGGHASGEVASEAVMESLSGSLENLHDAIEKSDIPAIECGIAAQLRLAVQQCNDELIDRMNSEPNLFGMATTLTAALIHEEKVWVAHAGDSRAYLLEGSKLTQLTRDHNMAAVAKKSGVQWGNSSHVLWNCLGGKRPDALEIDLTQCQLKPGCCLILCTDGLTNHVTEDEMSKIVRNAATSKEACQSLVDLANRRGGSDNITVVVSKREGDFIETKQATAAAEFDDADTLDEEGMGPIVAKL